VPLTSTSALSKIGVARVSNPCLHRLETGATQSYSPPKPLDDGLSVARAARDRELAGGDHRVDETGILDARCGFAAGRAATRRGLLPTNRLSATADRYRNIA
jgi:hypothetical protein